MARETEKFLQLEQFAQELVQTLEKLKNEALSYKTSTQELNKVSQKLSEHIDALTELVKSTESLTSTLESIGPEIFTKLSNISLHISEESKNIQNEHNQKISLLSKQLYRIKFLVIISLSIAILSAIGIFVLFLR